MSKKGKEKMTLGEFSLREPFSWEVRNVVHHNYEPYIKDPFPSLPPYKYDEARLLKEFNDYIASTYKGHYVGEDNIQSLDLIFAAGAGRGFCQGNVLKYAGPRLGIKGGPKEERADILKVMHYAMLLLFLLDKKTKKESENEQRTVSK